MATRELTTGASEIELARQFWGDEMAKKVLGNLITCTQEANEQIRPPSPVDVLQIQIADIPLTHSNGVPAPRMMGLHTKAKGFSLVLDSKSPQSVLDLTRVVVFHETARVHVYQHRVTEGHYADNSNRSVLDTFVEDGMVICAVESLVPYDQQCDTANFTSYDIAEPVIEEWIEKFIALSQNETDWDALWKMRLGDTDLPRPGYRIGHAIVRSAMDAYDFAPVEMLRQAPEFYAEHARLMLES